MYIQNYISILLFAYMICMSVMILMFAPFINRHYLEFIELFEGLIVKKMIN